jgi:hydroxyacylglutathione hydrolase
MRVVVIPCLSDNYAYLVAPDTGRDAVVVDPSEAAPVLAALERENLRLVAILNTHHHHDHVGGNEELLAKLGPMPVYAHASDEGRVPGQTERVEEGHPFTVARLVFDPLHVPGHTTGAVAYGVENAIFTGDTLFVAGCGRLFEGTPAMMHRSLVEKLGTLPTKTRVYCGHEYTVANLKFAQAVEPGNKHVADRLAKAVAKREAGEPTVPSTIREELMTNPFLRVGEATVRAACEGLPPRATAIDVLAAVRTWKDGFRAS